MRTCKQANRMECPYFLFVCFSFLLFLVPPELHRLASPRLDQFQCSLSSSSSSSLSFSSHVRWSDTNLKCPNVQKYAKSLTQSSFFSVPFLLLVLCVLLFWLFMYFDFSCLSFHRFRLFFLFFSYRLTELFEVTCCMIGQITNRYIYMCVCVCEFVDRIFRISTTH